MTATGAKPDPHALALAMAMQELRPRDTVFLCGSRAVGEHRENSDIDLFVVTAKGTRGFDTETAAREWLREHPPEHYASSLEMDREEFQRFYKVAQNFAGQAVRHGIAMNGGEIQLAGPASPGRPGAATDHQHVAETDRRAHRNAGTGEEARLGLGRDLRKACRVGDGAGSQGAADGVERPGQVQARHHADVAAPRAHPRLGDARADGTAPGYGKGVDPHGL